MRKLFFVLLVVLAMASSLQVAYAGALDLTTAGASGTVNNAIFRQVDSGSVGTGVISSFLRIQKGGTEQGYNTDYRPLEFDENNAANFTRSLLLSNVPVVQLDGIKYRQFLLDINEENNGDKPYLSLDKLQIFLGSSGNLTGYAPTGGGLGTKVYDLDTVSNDSWIKLDFNLNPGSGYGDMFAYIPESSFVGVNGSYVYLYSAFGEHYISGDGFEEWAVQGVGGGSPVPEPATVMAAFAILSPAALMFRRRK